MAESDDINWQAEGERIEREYRDRQAPRQRTSPIDRARNLQTNRIQAQADRAAYQPPSAGRYVNPNTVRTGNGGTLNARSVTRGGNREGDIVILPGQSGNQATRDAASPVETPIVQRRTRPGRRNITGFVVPILYRVDVDTNLDGHFDESRVYLSGISPSPILIATVPVVLWTGLQGTSASISNPSGSASVTPTTATATGASGGSADGRTNLAWIERVDWAATFSGTGSVNVTLAFNTGGGNISFGLAQTYPTPGSYSGVEVAPTKLPLLSSRVGLTAASNADSGTLTMTKYEVYRHLLVPVYLAGTVDAVYAAWDEIEPTNAGDTKRRYFKITPSGAVETFTPYVPSNACEASDLNDFLGYNYQDNKSYGWFDFADFDVLLGAGSPQTLDIEEYDAISSPTSCTYNFLGILQATVNPLPATAQILAIAPHYR